MQAEKFLVIGSDKKMQACRSRLNELGFEASCCDGESLKKKLPHYRSIILPIPTVANGFISGTGISVGELCDKLSKDQFVFYGNLGSNPFGEKGKSYYNKSFLIKNSRLTAQGTMRIILESTDRDIYTLKSAVLGYGKCGRAICKSLRANGADTTVVTRNPFSAVLAENEGLKSIGFKDFCKEAADFDIIVNTVPCNILGKETMEKLTKRNMYIEIASKPYGFNINEIDKYNFRYVLAESLPGRFTPTSAGANIADTVIEMIKEDKNE